MTHIIVAATPVFGHFEPMRAIAADLVTRGHEVTVLTGSSFREAATRTGATFAPLLGNADLTMERLLAVQAELARLPPGLIAQEHGLRSTILAAMPEQFSAVQRLLDRAGHEPTLLIHETLFNGAWPLRLGAPGLRPHAVIGIGVSPLTLSSRDLAPFGMALPPDNSPAGRQRNRELAARPHEEITKTQAFLTSMLRELGAREAPPPVHDAMSLLTDRYLQLTIESLEYPRSDAPAGLRFIGTLPRGTQERSELPSWWQDVLDARRVVVVSQGTLANRDFSELIEPTLRALADLDVLVVATLGRAAALANVPANARVAEFMPFDALLPHADVLVTNGGYGGVQHALSHGVPLVVAGESEDKAEVAARVAWAKTGWNLAAQRPAESDIRRAVETVLSASAYRDRARSLQREYSECDAFGSIASTIDELLLRRE